CPPMNPIPPPSSTPPPPHTAPTPPLPKRKHDDVGSSKKRKSLKTRIPTSQRVLRSHKELELAESLLHISMLVEKPKEEDLLEKVDRLEKEIQELKGALKNMEKAKGKRILQGEKEEG
ncbi:hypothetical protein KI387_022239, partial [Taxus chinensis]